MIKVIDEETGLSTILEHGGGHRPLVLPVPIPLSEDISVLSTLDTARKTIVATKDSEASHDLQDLQA